MPSVGAGAEPGPAPAVDEPIDIRWGGEGEWEPAVVRESWDGGFRYAIPGSGRSGFRLNDNEGTTWRRRSRAELAQLPTLELPAQGRQGRRRELDLHEPAAAAQGGVPPEGEGRVLVICAACGHVRVPEQQSAGAGVPPAPGDFWLCPTCGQVHRFTGEVLTPSDLGRAALGRERFARVRRSGDDELEQLPDVDRRALLGERERIRAQGGVPRVLGAACPVCGADLVKDRPDATLVDAICPCGWRGSNRGVPLCGATLYGRASSACRREKGHEGSHRAADGDHWTDEAPEAPHVRAWLVRALGDTLNAIQPGAPEPTVSLEAADRRLLQCCALAIASHKLKPERYEDALDHLAATLVERARHQEAADPGNSVLAAADAFNAGQGGVPAAAKLPQLNCNGCGRFMLHVGASMDPSGARTDSYECDNCGQASVIDTPAPPARHANLADGIAQCGWLLAYGSSLRNCGLEAGHAGKHSTVGFGGAQVGAWVRGEPITPAAVAGILRGRGGPRLLPILEGYFPGAPASVLELAAETIGSALVERLGRPAELADFIAREVG